MSNTRITLMLPRQKDLKRVACGTPPDSPCRMIEIAPVESDEKKLSRFEFATNSHVERKASRHSASSHSISLEEMDLQKDIDTDTESVSGSDHDSEQEFDDSDDEAEAKMPHCHIRSKP